MTIPPDGTYPPDPYQQGGYPGMFPPGQEERIRALEEQVGRLTALVDRLYVATGVNSVGSPAPTVDPQVADLVARGEMIAAIKRYREVTGVGLAEAKHAVEAMRR